MTTLYLFLLFVPVGALGLLAGLDRLEQSFLRPSAQLDPRTGLTVSHDVSVDRARRD